MLIRFRVSNFRSLQLEQELSMIAARSARSPAGQVQKGMTGLNLLRVAAIYGANAAGKSNVLDALKFMRSAVENSHRTWKPNEEIQREPFLLDPAGKDTASSWEVEFLLEGVRHRYGFELDSTEVTKEWLYVYPHGRRQRWFERNAHAEHPFQFGKHLTGNNRTTAALTRKNSLFISAAAANNHPMMSSVYSWFVTKLVFTGSEMLTMRLARAMFGIKNREKSLLDLLKKADLGIGGLEVQHEPAAPEVMDLISHVIKDEGFREKVLHQAKEQPFLKLRHSPTDALLAMEQESRGTQAWFSLAVPLLDVLESGAVLCVDELDASLHPHLALECIRAFDDHARNPHNAQLIFNTHDTTLLGSLSGRIGLRRDQVWFVEKDRMGASHLYPLTDFKPRNDENLERGYLQGRYGAIPFIGPAFFADAENG